MVIRVPYNIVEFLLGKSLAPYFNEICALLTLIGLIIYLTKPRKKRRVAKPDNNTKPVQIDIDEQGRMRYDSRSKTDGRSEEKRWYSTGWYFDEKIGKWTKPDYTHPEINANDPAYQEWKKQYMDAKGKQYTPPNTATEQGTYRYDYVHTPFEQQQHFHNEDTTLKSTVLVKAAPKEEPKTERPKSKYAEAYEVTPLLTYNESRNYKTLYDVAEIKGYRICPKVRLADIVKPRNDEKYMTHFGKIKAKHVDFAICDKNMKVLAVIELDDNSHNRPDRIERDKFVDEILQANGIKVVHTRHITHDILDNI